MAALPARRASVSSRELTEAHLDRGRARQPRAQRLADDRPRARARRGRRRRRAAGRRPARRPDRALDALRPLLGIPVALKDLVSLGGRPVHRRLADPRGLPRAVRRAHHRAAARGRRGDPRQDQHGRVRDGLVDRALGATGPTANPWALDRVPGGSSGGSAAAVAAYHAPLVDRHRHRRLDPPAGGAVRHRRDEADVRAGQPLRDRRVRQLARPDRAVRPRRARRGGAAPRRRRSRRARLDVVAEPGAGRR